jgi:transcriptional regulator with XRE-family HTH domain
MIPEERKIFARNFRRARLTAGLSQAELHQLTGLAQSYISEVERGVRNVSLDKMACLAQAVQTPLHELLLPAPENCE